MSLYSWTGNPFVDNGIAIIMQYYNKRLPEDISIGDFTSTSVVGSKNNLVEMLCETLSQPEWIKVQNTIFTSNSPITNHKVKNKRAAIEKMLSKLINELGLQSKFGNCFFCGKRDSQEMYSRTDLPLSGYVHSHFFSHQSRGYHVCSPCLLAIQCSTLAHMKCGSKILVLHSGNEEVMKYWAAKCLHSVLKQRISKSYSGALDEGYTNALNSLFKLTDELIVEIVTTWDKQEISITAYHYTNFTQLPDKPLEIYMLPGRVFIFLALIRKTEYYKDWLKILHRGYYYSLKTSEKNKLHNKGQSDSGDAYYKFRKTNIAFSKLMQGESILHFFIDRRSKTAVGEWNFLKIYLQEIENMDIERIKAIKELADKLSIVIKEQGKKALVQLEMASNYYSFLSVLLKLSKRYVLSKKDEPLVLFDDLINKILPEGNLSYKETQYLLLFRIYEELHAWITQNFGEEDEAPEEDFTEIETHNN